MISVAAVVVIPVSILTSMLYVNLLAQTISEIKQGVLKLLVGALGPLCTIYWIT